jgi:hypothetical protein
VKTVIYEDVPGRGLDAFHVLDLSETLRYQVENGPTLHVSVPGRPVVYLRFHRLEFLPGRSVLIGVTDTAGATEIRRWCCTSCPNDADFFLALERAAALITRVSGV